MLSILVGIYGQSFILKIRLRIFIDNLTLDMINMMKLHYVPGCCEWVHTAGDPVSVLSV